MSSKKRAEGKDNTVESRSQKEKNYANPVPKAFGEIRLSKTSTALCMAVLALESTDTMASWMTWPAPWAPADGHMSMPAGCLAAKRKISQKRHIGPHITTFFAKTHHQQCEGVCASDAGGAGLGHGCTGDDRTRGHICPLTVQRAIAFRSSKPHSVP